MNDDNNSDLDERRTGARLLARSKREDLRLTQRELAALAGIRDVKTINNFESGRTWPSATNRRAIAKALGWVPNALDQLEGSLLADIEDRGRTFELEAQFRAEAAGYVSVGIPEGVDRDDPAALAGAEAALLTQYQQAFRDVERCEDRLQEAQAALTRAQQDQMRLANQIDAIQRRWLELKGGDGNAGSTAPIDGAGEQPARRDLNLAARRKTLQEPTED